MNYTFLSNTALFRGIPEEELPDILSCLQAAEAGFEKGEQIFRCGQMVQALGLVLSGSVLVESDDLWGNHSIIGHMEAGQIFGETYACIPGEPLLIQVTAAEKTRVLFLNVLRVLETVGESGRFHQVLIQNLLRITAQKNLMLSRRILYTSPKSIRERIMAYLSDRARQTGSYTVTVPFNRQQLADYLGVDRSALSNALSKMQGEGLLRYERNTFYLTELSR